jgi:hypothetical protein
MLGAPGWAFLRSPKSSGSNRLFRVRFGMSQFGVSSAIVSPWSPPTKSLFRESYHDPILLVSGLL